MVIIPSRESCGAGFLTCDRPRETGLETCATIDRPIIMTTLHIIENHWEIEDYLDEILNTVRLGRRKQSADVPSKYKYSKAFEYLPHDYTHIVVVVKLEPDNFIITAYPIRRGRRRR